MARVFLVLAVLAGVLFAGCTDEPAPPVEEPDPLPALATFAGCPWNYFDGSAVDCEQLPVELVVEPMPNGWVCLGEDAREGWSFHWNPVTDERGIWFDVEVNETAVGNSSVDAVLRFKTNEEITLYNWSDSPLSGFIRVPANYGENVTFRFLLYNVGYAWNGTGLASASADEVWSLHDDQFWVVHRVTTGNTTYTFQHMNSYNSTKQTAEGAERIAFHEPQTFFIRGADFHFSAVYNSLFFGRALQGVATIGIDRQCQVSGLAPLDRSLDGPSHEGPLAALA